jgi:predicted small secreted protein
MKFIPLYLLISLLTLTGLSGCNTLEGLGKDIQSLGRETEEATDLSKT